MGKTFEEVGRVAEIKPTETVTMSNGEPYNKRMLVLEVQNGQYVDRLPFNFGGVWCERLNDLCVGQTVSVSFRLSGWKDRSLFVRPTSFAVVDVVPIQAEVSNYAGLYSAAAAAATTAPAPAKPAEESPLFTSDVFRAW